MALKQGSERFTKFTHVENGRVLTRRLHRIQVQARDGRLYILKGENLPDYIETCCGHGHKGEHLAQILLNPSKVNTGTYLSFTPPPWPSARDVLNFVLGIGAMMLVEFLSTCRFV